MVEDDVEDDLDAGRVQGPDHLLELADLGPRLLAHRIAAMRREEAKRIVTPIVGPRRAIAEAIQDGELVDRHQLDRRDPSDFK